MSLLIKKMFVGFCILVSATSLQAQADAQKEIRLTLIVSDNRGRYAGALKADAVRVTVDKKPQEITLFAKDDSPATVVFLVDLSASMTGKIESLTKEVVSFIKDAAPGNQYLLIGFNEKIQTVLDEPQNFQALEETLSRISAARQNTGTAFYDAVYEAIEKSNSGRHRRKVVILCSDGQDNKSRLHTMRDVGELLKQTDVLFYPVNYNNLNDLRTAEKETSLFNSSMAFEAREKLSKLSRISGGAAFHPVSPAELTTVFKLIDLELKNQYRLGFRVTDLTKPDEWRDVKVFVAPATDGNKEIKLSARTRVGFYPASAK